MTKYPKRLQVIKVLDPDEAKPFKIIEMVDTSEGPRSRICSGRWAKESEAREELVLRMRKWANGAVI